LLFGKLLEQSKDNEDGHLSDLEKELKIKIEKAKTIAETLKSVP
jgi:hypothetical protein